MPLAGNDPAYWIGLQLVPGLGGATYRKLLKTFGGPEAVFSAGYTALSREVPAQLAEAIAAGPDEAAVASALAWLERPENHLITLADDGYPPSLFDLPDPPPLLYVKGRPELLRRDALAVVGSRNATLQGAADARAFSRALSDAGLCIVSGLALGIDAAAHRGGLEGASGSVAVVGTGLDTVYPARNRDLAHALAEGGALVSEFPLGSPAKADHFPRRNRIISGLSRGCLVVEAALHSGSLITARLAAEQGREVFAIPGSIHSPLSKGCHGLIKQGAKLVESVEDILSELNWAATGTGSIRPGEQVVDGAHPLLACLGGEPVDVDTLVQRSGLTCDRVCAMLLELELEGNVASLPGGLYQRIWQPPG
jgi:DNA processing protein